MEEESLGDKLCEKLLQESYKSDHNLRSKNARNISKPNKDLWIHGYTKILFVFLSLTLASISSVHGQSPPPNYNYKKLPETSFTCEDKATGGYYADPEAGCQMFHVCLRVSEEQINDFKFLCPNNTVFDQQNFICTNWWEIDCKQSTRYYSKNDLFRVNEETTTAEPEYVEQTGHVEFAYEYVDPEPLTKNVTVHKLPDSAVTQNKRRKPKITTTSTTSAPTTTYTFRTTVLPSTVSTPWHSTTITPEVTTSRKRHRFSYQSEDNIGRRAYQPTYGNKEEQPSPEELQRTAESERMSKSFDGQHQQSQARQFRRKRPQSSRLVSAQSDKTSSTNEQVASANNTSTNTTSAPRMKALRRKSNRRQKTVSPTKPKEKHKEFSNFRFYKTAFGRSYSSDDYIYTSTTPRSTQRRARFRRPRRLRTGRTASRNTRYSKYAR